MLHYILKTFEKHQSEYLSISVSLMGNGAWGVTVNGGNQRLAAASNNNSRSYKRNVIHVKKYYMV